MTNSNELQMVFNSLISEPYIKKAIIYPDSIFVEISRDGYTQKAGVDEVLMLINTKYPTIKISNAYNGFAGVEFEYVLR